VSYLEMQEIRRKDRAISQAEAETILSSAEYGVLSTVSSDNIPYGIPLSFCVLSGDIYFHCAMHGRKIDNLEQNAQVSFCAVGDTEVLPDKFGTKYESAVVSGQAVEVFDDEKQLALEGLINKYSAEFVESGAKYIEALTHKTRVFKIVVETLSGKSRRS
jgi:nitroimidazol reductase NimA-like FMN-containing flavoprotein (pyridoxamine 5'-phosphate oxidase superfamily)